MQYLDSKTFDQSDHYIARNISCLIKMSWTDEEVKTRAQKMREVILASVS